VRLVATVVVLALLFPAAAPMAARVADARCCTSKSRGTCPMKRKAARCAKHAAVSCCARQTEPLAATYPSIRDHYPALLLETSTHSVPTSGHFLGVAQFGVMSRVPFAPDPPPPKRA
jgi:hypothetical protein